MILREPPPEHVAGRPVLFMDTDGVLNGHERHGNGYCGTRPDCVTRMNRVLNSTNCLIVMSSAWRYLVLNEHMTVVGLENLFLTHGLHCLNRLWAVVRLDQDQDTTDRGRQISEFRSLHCPDARIAVVDDREFDIRSVSLPFVQTDPFKGLTDEDAEALIGLLGGPVDHSQEFKHRDWRRS